MKKVCSLLFTTFVFFSAFAQISSDDGLSDPKNGSSQSTSFGTNTLGYVHCGVCGKWHYLPYCKPTPPPTPTPIDGGVSLLLVAGAAYGVKRFRNKKGE